MSSVCLIANTKTKREQGGAGGDRLEKFNTFGIPGRVDKVVFVVVEQGPLHAVRRRLGLLETTQPATTTTTPTLQRLERKTTKRWTVTRQLRICEDEGKM